MIMENHLQISYSTREEDKHRQQQQENGLVEEEDDDDEYEEEETEKLEEEVREIAKKVDERRSTLPDHLESSIFSYLSSQRPSFSLLDNDDNGSLPGPSSGPHSGLGNSSAELEADGGVKIPDEVQLLKDKISSNVSAIPKGLKRMNDCISRIDKLISSNERIPPAFKRKKS